MKKKPSKKKSAPKLTKKKPQAKSAKKAPMKKKPAAAQGGDSGASVAKLIDERIRELGGWRGQTMGRMRALLREAAPEMIEERKWIKPSNPHGVPTYSHAGLVCTLEVYKAAVKVTFANGAKVPDPSKLFNASLLGTRRAIDVHEGESVDEAAFKALVRAAVAVNASKNKK